MKFATQVVHAGIEPDPMTGAVMTPIYQTSTYAQPSPGQHKGYEYSRTDNPTRTALQNQLAVLEGAECALVFSSGLAAIDAVLNLLSFGDHVVAANDLYGGSYRIFTKVASDRGVKFTFVDMTDHAAVAAAILPETKLVWFETPTNPMLTVLDIRAIAEIAHAHGALCAVDNTFLTPAFQRPLELGADIVMHSMTKYLNGHSDVVMGALMFDDQPLTRLASAQGESLYARLKFLQNAIGAVPGPMDCFLALRGLKTLDVRMMRHEANARWVAEYLESQNKVERVIYPGLTSHPQHDLAVAQTDGHGGMVTFLVKGGLSETMRFLESLKLFTLAESLGGVESLIEHPAIMTHASIPPEERAKIGIGDSLVRVSVGIESSEDLIQDLEAAFAEI
ncbi:PLP-dependent aspartate aminotransferase family protein [soil metagenome]